MLLLSSPSLQHPWKVTLILTLTGSHSTNLGPFLLLSAFNTQAVLTSLSLVTCVLLTPAMNQCHLMLLKDSDLI